MHIAKQHELITGQMERLKLTPTEAARLIGIDRSYFHQVIKGRHKLPKRAIPKAAQVLHIDPDVLWITGGSIPPDLEESILKYPKLIAIIRKHRDLMDSR